jgi:superfamily II DNA or RNA helicase
MTIKDEVQQRALAEILKYRRSGAVLSVGAGKTKLGLMYLTKVGGKTLILLPKLDIIKSWKDDAVKFNYESVLENITFSTYISLKKQDLSQFQNIIMDEAHSLKEHQDSHLGKFQGNILGLTGTPPNRGPKFAMMQKYYPIRFVFKTDAAVDKGMLNDYRIFVHKIHLSTTKNIPVKNFMVSERSTYEWATKQCQMASTEKSKMFANIRRVNYLKQFNSKERYVQELLKKIKEDEKCIIFANTIAQAERLCSYSHHSEEKNDYLEAFKEGLINRLSCIDQLSEGINIPQLKHAIIMHSYSSSSPKMVQRLGRTLRLSPDQTAEIHILCYKDTVDETWVEGALKNFNQAKISVING